MDYTIISVMSRVERSISTSEKLINRQSKIYKTVIKAKGEKIVYFSSNISMRHFHYICYFLVK